MKKNMKVKLILSITVIAIVAIAALFILKNIGITEETLPPAVTIETDIAPENEVIEVARDLMGLTVSLDNFDQVWKEFQVFYDNGRCYIAYDDFIELVDRINLDCHLLKNVDESLVDFNTNKISLSLNYKAVKGRDALSDFRIGTSNTLMQTVNEGQDKEVTLDLSDYHCEAIYWSEKYYLPVDVINNMIFTGRSRLIFNSKVTAVIDLIYDSTNENYVFQELKLENMKENYQLDCQIIDQYLKDNYKVYETPKVLLDQTDIVDYNGYILNAMKQFDQLADYHWFQFLPAGKLNQSAEFKQQMSAFYDLSNKKEMDEASSTQSPLFNKETRVIDSKIYIPITEFNDDVITKVMGEVNGLENQDYSEWVFDMRGNPGGQIKSAYRLLNLLSYEEIELAIASMYQGEILGKTKYTFKNNKYDGHKTNKIYVILDAQSASASISLANLLHSNFDCTIIGQEPKHKQSSNIVFFQLPDLSIFTLSSNDYKLLNQNGEIVDRSAMIDIEMDNEAIEQWLKDPTKID